MSAATRPDRFLIDVVVWLLVSLPMYRRLWLPWKALRSTQTVGVATGVGGNVNCHRSFNWIRTPFQRRGL